MSADPTTTRSFTQFLGEIEDGHLQNELTQTLQEVVGDLHNAAVNTGGKSSGTLTIKLSFKVDGGVIEVTPEVATKLPKVKRGRSIFWATPENNLTRRDPRQRDLPLRDVTASSSTLRTA
jgi:hypothetical protein